MNGLIDYVLILGFTAIAVYIIYNMVIKMNGSKPENKPPAFVDTPNAKQIAQLSSVEGTTSSSGLSNHQFDPSVDNAIRNYCIKSSSNSAYTGGYMNLNMIKYVLSRGCRFWTLKYILRIIFPLLLIPIINIQWIPLHQMLPRFL